MTPATAAGLCSHCGAEHVAGTDTCPLTGKFLSVPGLCGTEVDRYRVERMLGGGGFGAVYQAYHTVMGRLVALKVLDASQRANPAVLQRFFQEARAANSIGNPHIVQIFDAGWSDNKLPFLAMELLNGCSLHQVLQETPVLRVDRALTIAAQVLEGLGAAHAAGIIHRDVKSGNVMLVGTTPDGTEQLDFVKLVDFGISKFREQESGLTRSGMTLGTPGCAAPEQYMDSHRVDHRADIYAVAVLLFQMLSGRLPFEPTTYEKMVIQVATEDPPPLRQVAPMIPPELAAVIDRGLCRQPDARWPDAATFAHALSAACGGAIAMPDPAPSSSDHVPLALTTPTPTPIGAVARQYPVPIAPTVGATPGTTPAAPIARTISSGNVPLAAASERASAEPAVIQPQVQRPIQPQPRRRLGFAYVAIVFVLIGIGAAGGVVVWVQSRTTPEPTTTESTTTESTTTEPTVPAQPPIATEANPPDAVDPEEDQSELSTELAATDSEEPADVAVEEPEPVDEPGEPTPITRQSRAARDRWRQPRPAMMEAAAMEEPVMGSGEDLRPGLVPFDR